MSFLGIDQSLNSTGACLLNGDGAVLDLITIRPGQRRDGERLAYIKQGIASLSHGVLFAAMEGYSYDSVGRVFELGEVGGVLKVCLVEHAIPYLCVPPGLVKKFATGSGAAQKGLMVEAARAAGAAPADDNQADAFFLARIAYCRYAGAARLRCELEVLQTLQAGPRKRSPRRPRKLVKSAI